MKMKTVCVNAALVGSLLSASGAALADKKTDHTLIGVGLGALAGALFSNGDPMAALAGAAAGGAIGNIATDDKKRVHQGDWRENQRLERQREAEHRRRLERERWKRQQDRRHDDHQR